MVSSPKRQARSHHAKHVRQESLVPHPRSATSSLLQILRPRIHHLPVGAGQERRQDIRQTNNSIRHPFKPLLLPHRRRRSLTHQSREPRLQLSPGRLLRIWCFGSCQRCRPRPNWSWSWPFDLAFKPGTTISRLQQSEEHGTEST